MAAILRVLIIEDYPHHTELVVRALRRGGFDPVWESVETEAEYVEKLHAGWDVVISDYVLPQFNGLRALELLKQAGLQIPFLIVSGAIGEDVAVAAMKQGATDYLLKDRMARLGPAVAQAVEKDRLRRGRLRAEEELRDAQSRLSTTLEQSAELRAVNHDLESFSYSVSHDLRAPLRHIRCYTELLEAATDGQLDEKPRHYLKAISEAAGEMGQLIDDLLAFAQSGLVELRSSPLSLNQLAADVIKGMGSALEGRAIVWKIAPMPIVAGDPALLKQVLVNLLGNAVKFTRLRTPARIEMGWLGEWDGRARFFVRDNGAGFNMDDTDRLFRVFQRGHQSEDFEGTGIGLAIVSRIIGRHGGSVSAEGAVNEGATFYFNLKLAALHTLPPEHP